MDRVLHRTTSPISFAHLEQNRDADAHWSALNEISLFGSDFLLSKYPQMKEFAEFECSSSFMDCSDDWHKLSGIVEEDEQEGSTNISHYFSEVLSQSSSIANSSFSTVLYKRVKLLRRIQEACWRQKQREKQGIANVHTAGGGEVALSSSAPSNLNPNDYDDIGLLPFGASTPPRRKAIPSNSDKATKEESEKTDPKKQTLEALYQLLEKTTSENRLRENIPGILQLLSDLPPYSLFNEENTTLDTFEETLISFLEKTDNAKQKIKNRQQSPGPSIFTQAESLLLILALMRGSLKTSLISFSRFLDADPTVSKEELEDKKGKPKGKGKEESLPSVTPYLKQLEDYRKHKELCSLFEDGYQGAFKYYWQDSSYSLFSSHQGANANSMLASIATDGRFLYILNKEGLLKIGTGIYGSGTIRGHVYNYRTQYAANEKAWLICVNNTLYYRTVNTPLPILIRINPSTLEEEGEVRLSLSEKESLLPTFVQPGSYVPLISDGKLIYLVAELRNGSKIEYKLFAYDPSQSFRCVASTVLQGPHTLTGQHLGVVCDGCQRSAFRGQRYKCTDSVCREYNLCHTCQQLGVTNKQHRKEHVIELIAEPQPGPASLALSSQAMITGHFYTTGHQLGVIFPPGTPPNSLRRNKYMSRIFNIRQGRHIHDFMVDNINHGACVCFDRRNNLLWTHAPDSYSVMRWNHFGKISPSFTQTDPVTMLTRHTLPQGKTTPQQIISRQKAAMLLLANISILAERLSSQPCVPCKALHKHPFVVDNVDHISDVFSAIYTLMVKTLSREGASVSLEKEETSLCETFQSDESESEETSPLAIAGTSVGSDLFVLGSLLRLLAANLCALCQSSNPESISAIAGMSIFDIRDVLLRLATGQISLKESCSTQSIQTHSQAENARRSTGNKIEERAIQREARRCLLLGMRLFYPAKAKQIQLLLELLERIKQEENFVENSLYTSSTKLLFTEFLEVARSDCNLDEVLFPPLESEKEQVKSKEETDLGTEHAEAENREKRIGSEDAEKRQNEKIISDLIDYSILQLLAEEQNTLGMPETKEREKENESNSTITQAILNLVIVVQRDLLSLLFSSHSDDSAYSSTVFSTSTPSANNLSPADVSRISRYTSLIIDKSIECLRKLVPADLLNSKSDKAHMWIFIKKMETLQKSIIGAVLLPLATSLCQFGNRLEFVDLLPKFLEIIKQIDKVNVFIIASEQILLEIEEQEREEERKREKQRELEKEREREAERERVDLASLKGRRNKDRKARSSRHNNIAPSTSVPTVSSRPLVKKEEKKPYDRFAWFFDLENTFGVLCGMLSAALVTGGSLSSKEKSLLSYLESELLSAGLEETEMTEKMDIERGGTLYGQLISEEKDTQVECLPNWINSYGPKLPIPVQAVTTVNKAIRSIFAALVKHNALESDMLEFANDLRKDFQRKQHDGECEKMETEEERTPPSPSAALQSALATASAVRLWIVQQQQKIINEAEERQEEEEKERQREKERREIRMMQEEKEKARHQLLQLQRQLQETGVQLEDEVMWQILLEEQEELRRKKKEGTNNKDEEDSEEDEEDEDEDEEEEEDEEQHQHQRQLQKEEEEDEDLPPVTPLPTREEVYIKVATQLIEGATFLLKFVSSQQCSALPSVDTARSRAVINFIQLLLPPDSLQFIIDCRILRANSRTKGLQLFYDLLKNCVTVYEVKREILKYLGRSLRQTGSHYLDGLEGCSSSQQGLVRTNFAKMFSYLLTSLDPRKDEKGSDLEKIEVKIKILALNALSLEYKIEDYRLFAGSNFFDILQKLSSVCMASSQLVPKSKSLAQEKRLVRVAQSVLCLTATRVLEWVPSTFERDSEKIIQLQDAIVRMIFGELSNMQPCESTSVTMASEKQAGHDKKSLKLDDEYHYTLLTMLYRLKHTAAMKRYLSHPTSVRSLLGLLQLGSPRVQRPVTRLCKHALLMLNPADFYSTQPNESTCDTKKENLLEYFLDILGLLISGKYSSPFASEHLPEVAGTPCGTPEDDEEGKDKSNNGYALIIHRPAGITLSDLLRMMPHGQLTDGSEINMKEVVKDLKAIDQAVVLRDATIEQCRKVANVLATKGWSVTIAHQDRTEKRNEESLFSTSPHSRYWRSRHVDFSHASEIISLLRSLLITLEWRDQLIEKIRSYLTSLGSLNNMLQNRIKGVGVDEDEEIILQQRVLAALAVLGGWNEIPRVGGRVRIKQPEVADTENKTSGSEGTVVSFQSQHIVKVLMPNCSYRTFTVDELAPIPDVYLDPSLFRMTKDILQLTDQFLELSNSYIRRHKTESSLASSFMLYAETRFRLVKVVDRMWEDNESIRCCIEAAENGTSRLIPLIINDIAAYDPREQIKEERVKGKEKSLDEMEEDLGRQEHNKEVQDRISTHNFESLSLHALARRAFVIQEALHELEAENLPSAAHSSAALSSSALMDVESPKSERCKTKKNKPSQQKKEKLRRSSRGRGKGRGKGKDKEEKDKEEEEKIKACVASLSSGREKLMTWNENSGNSLVYLGLDRLSIQFHGINGDCLIHVSPDLLAEQSFYFEVTIDFDDNASGVGIGLCPANALPGWGDCFYEYRGHNGKKVAPRQKNEDEVLHHCPYCEQDKLTAVELCHHTSRRHIGSSLPVVCPICANTPLGDPNYISSNFFGHLENSHSDLLYAGASSAQELSYGPAFGSGDVIGCGWSSEGIIYFTKNGSYLGPAFIDVAETRLVPMVRIRASGVEVTTNFGSKPFTFTAFGDRAQKDAEIINKLRQDQEALAMQLRQAEDDKLAAREVQAEILMGFVGLPKDFCIYALLHNNDNIEEAASWSFDNFNQWSADQVQLQSLASPRSSSEQRPARSPTTKTRSLVYPGEAYSFVEDPQHGNGRAASSSSLQVSKLIPGTKCTVSDRAVDTFDPTGWVDAKYKTIGRTGEIKEIDFTRLVALLQFYDPERAMREEWWFPLQSLNLACEPKTSNFVESKKEIQENDQRNNADLRKLITLREELLITEIELARLYSRNAIINLLTHWPDAFPLSLSTLGGPSGLLKTLHLIAKEYLCQPIPILNTESVQSNQRNFMQILWQSLQQLCKKEKTIDLAELLLEEAKTQLKASADFSRTSILRHESEHLQGADNFVQAISINGAKGLIITFDRQSKFSETDTLTFFLDDGCTKPYRSFTGSSLGQFYPVVMNCNKFWLRFEKQNGVSSEPQWKYTINVIPTNESLNLALWISEFLIEGGFDDDDSVQREHSNKEWISRVSRDIYNHLTEYLKTSKAPEILKTVIIRLLKRLLSLSLDDFIHKWERMQESRKGKRKKEGAIETKEQEKGLREEKDNEVDLTLWRSHLSELVEVSECLENSMFDLLAEPDLLYSPYLQNLTELVVIKRKLGILISSDMDKNTSLPTISFYPASFNERLGDNSVTSADADEDIKASFARTVISDATRMFNYIAALDETLNCFLFDKDFPQPFVEQFKWKPSMLYDNAPEFALASTTKLKLADKGRLTARSQMVFTEVFYRFAHSQPGTMSPEELNMLQIHCHPNEPLSEEDLRYFFEKFQTEGGRLTLKGFLDLYYKEAYHHPKNVWEELLKFGYDQNLVLSTNVAMQWCRASRWSQCMDEQLVELVNQLTEMSGKKPLSISPDDIMLNNTVDKQRYPALAHMPQVALKLRFACIKQLNSLLTKALPFIDLNQVDVAGSLAQRLCSLRHLIFYQTKVEFLDSVLARTASTRPPPSITVARLNTVLRLSRDRLGFFSGSNAGLSMSAEAEAAAKEKTVFMQVFRQLANLPPSCLRHNERAFKVTLKGERVEGEVGPYQETISQICSELQPEDFAKEETKNENVSTSTTTSASSATQDSNEILQLFIPCPNRQQTGIGENRDKFIPKPSSHSTDHLKMYEFVGKLMGIAVRTKSILSLNLPSLFWKPLVGLNPTLNDLKAIDFSTCESLERLSEMDKEMFEAHVFQTFTAVLSDGSLVELVPEGKERNVTYDDRKEYVSLARLARLSENVLQIKAIMRGMATLVPLPVLSLFTWQDLEMRVCGKTEINLEVLKRNTRYRGSITENDAHIRYFWQVLEEFAQHERMLFLRFSWGRQRLPSETELKNEPMKIFPYPCDNPDARLPHAETCFFNLKLPQYSSLEVMRERLLYAITHTKTIDADLQEDNLNELLGRAGRRGGRGGGGRMLFGGRGAMGLSPPPFGSPPMSGSPPLGRAARGRGNI